MKLNWLKTNPLNLSVETKKSKIFSMQEIHFAEPSSWDLNPGSRQWAENCRWMKSQDQNFPKFFFYFDNQWTRNSFVQSWSIKECRTKKSQESKKDLSNELISDDRSKGGG